MSYNFDVEKTTKELIQWIRDWFDKNGKNCNAVIGISGGKDSTIVAKLCVEALGKNRVIGVLMPNHIQNDINDSHRVCDYLGIKNYTVDIGVAVDALINNIHFRTDINEFTSQTLTNLPPRIRMSTLYAISQSMNGRVINTSNYSERYIGWGTLFGDCAGDMGPLCNLTATEVVAIGDCLGIPTDLVHKVPADGLTSKSDEDNLGFSYSTLDKYIRTGICEDKDIKANIDRRHRINEFKRNPMVTYKLEI